MKGRIIIILAIATLVLTGASGFIYVTQDHTAPVIEVPSESLLYTEGENESVLLKGVTASDAEDGDLTSEVRIYDVSVLDDGKQAIVTYAVYDSHNNLGKESRLIDYKALVKPVAEEPTPEEEAKKDPETKKAEKIEKSKEKAKLSNSVTTTSNVVKLDRNDTSAQRQLELEEEERRRNAAATVNNTYYYGGDDGDGEDTPDPAPTPAPAPSQPAAPEPSGNGETANQGGGETTQPQPSGSGETSQPSGGETAQPQPSGGETSNQGGGEVGGGASGSGEVGGGEVGGGETPPPSDEGN